MRCFKNSNSVAPTSENINNNNSNIVRLLSDKNFPFSRPDGNKSWVQKVYIVFRTVFCVIVLLPLRFFIALFFSLLFYVLCRIATIGVKDFSQPFRNRRRILQQCGKIFARILLLAFGFVWIKRTGDSKLPQGTNLIVCNHLSWVDILILISECHTMPSFVAKIEVSKIPIFGFIAKVLQCIFVDRLAAVRGGNSAQLRSRALSNDMPPIAIFPEGTTTNGEAFLRFKTGTFLAGAPVKPVVLRFKFKYFSPSWECMHGGKHLFLTFTQLVNRVELNFLDVYNPSEDERSNPALYANNVCLFMSSFLKLPIVEYTYKEKLEYMEFLEKNIA